MPLTTPRRTPARSAGAVRLVVVGALVLAVAIAAALLVAQRGTSPRPQAGARSVVQGPQPKPARVRLADGRFLTCPRGAKPALVVEGLDVRPPLSGGTRFLRRTYRVVVRASVVNETDRPIRVGSFRAEIAGRPWRARVSAPSALPADAKSPVRVRGVFHSRTRRRASFATDFRWHWREAELRPCGAKGLTEDD